MLRALRWFIFGGFLGFAGGVLLGFLIYPYVFAPPTATETLSRAEQTPVVATGTFIHADPSDRIHWGKGSVTVRAESVFLEPDFEVGPGPKFHVYLSRKSGIRSSAEFDLADALDLGQIKSFRGSQKYDIPPGTDLAGYQSVIVWCKAFGVLISPADLRR
jgi:hypothetical protein